MTVALCRHIKTNGKACNSPALSGQPFCYFHQKLRRRHRNLAIPRPTPPAETIQEIVFDLHGHPVPQTLPAPQQPAPVSAELDLPLLEDRESVQVAISLVVSAIAHNRIDTRRAAAILYGLQLASNNTRHLVLEPIPSSLSPAIARGTSGFDLVPLHLNTPPSPRRRRSHAAPAPSPDPISLNPQSPEDTPAPDQPPVPMPEPPVGASGTVGV